MRHINLNSLVETYKNLDSQFFEEYLSLFEINLKDHEIKDLAVLLEQLKIHGINNLDNFYVGFSIHQINKEFDLLRFGEDTIINIELKGKSTTQKIEKQLKQNKYYLQFLGKVVHTFTFVTETSEIYKYDDTGILTTATFQELVSILDSQVIEEVEDISSVFKPSNYLVSPFNSTEKFINGEYFLTEHQGSIKNDIINRFNSLYAEFISIIGKPGTGKTLLTYDIANHYINEGLKVALVHCGKLNDGHKSLISNFGWNIFSIKRFSELNEHSFDILIVDEAQRLQIDQLDKIELIVNCMKSKCIFSFDPAQCFTNQESQRNIGALIEQNLKAKNFLLTDKIRTNKEIASFIMNITNHRNKNPNQSYNSIHVQFFNDEESARNYANELSQKGWEVLNFTNSLFNFLSYDRFQNDINKNSHDVIGQEFDNVAVFIDEHFYYDNKGILSALGVNGGIYDVDKMLYQNITRTREKLTIIVIKNKEILSVI